MLITKDSIKDFWKGGVPSVDSFRWGKIQQPNSYLHLRIAAQLLLNLLKKLLNAIKQKKAEANIRTDQCEDVRFRGFRSEQLNRRARHRLSCL